MIENPTTKTIKFSEEQKSAFEYLVNWYSMQCDGEWEHGYGITIDTLDNPGWEVKIDLHGTDLLSRRDFSKKIEYASENRWMTISKTGDVFLAFGGPSMLPAIIAFFRIGHNLRTERLQIIERLRNFATCGLTETCPPLKTA